MAARRLEPHVPPRDHAAGGLLGCEADERAVWEHRLASDPREYASRLLRATGTEWLLLDDGFPPAAAAFALEDMGELAGCTALPVLRIERRAEEALDRPLEELREHVREGVRRARGDGFVALKTIAAYRTGLDVRPPDEAAAAKRCAARQRGSTRSRCSTCSSGMPSRRTRPRERSRCRFTPASATPTSSSPGRIPRYLKPLLDRFRETPFVLLHCYPYVREAGGSRTCTPTPTSISR